MALSTTFSFGFISVIVMLCVLSGFPGLASAQLSTNFYSSSCPKVLTTVKSVVQSAISNENRIGASLLRLHFHDCFVNGCDASVLVDDTSSFTGEKTASPNNNSLRGFDVIDQIKTQVEKACPGIVSCADIVTIAARDSVANLGGPNWNVKLGRRDSKTASLSAANSGVIPAPSDNLSVGISNANGICYLPIGDALIISKFKAQGLSTTDLVTLSGAHTIGKARCTVFRAHIYNETNIDASFANTRQNNCPIGSGDNNLTPLDIQTSNAFDPKYYQNLINKKGLLHSDQELYNGGSTDSLVKTYSSSAKTFHSDFAKAMIKMGDNNPLTGSQGEVRKNCRKPN